MRDVARFGGEALEFLQARHALRDFVVTVVLQDPLADADRDFVGIERALDRKQPIVLLIPLADAKRLIGGAVQLLADLHLDERALLFDDNDEVEPGGELGKLPPAEWPDATDFVDANAQLVALRPRQCRAHRDA